MTASVRSIVSAAEQVADALQRDAEHRAHEMLTDAAAEADRRLQEAHREADRIVDERRRRVAETSDEILRQTEAVLGRLNEAGALGRQLDDVLAALAETADRLARERGGDPGERSWARAPEPGSRRPYVAVRGGLDDAGRAAPPPVEDRPPEGGSWTGGRPASAAVEAERRTALGSSDQLRRPFERFESRAGDPLSERSRDPAESLRAGHPSPGTGEQDPHSAAATAQEPSATPGGPAADRPGGDSSATEEDDEGFVGARLVALQMALEGSTRGEVAEHLQRVFGVREPQGILDDAFRESGKRA